MQVDVFAIDESWETSGKTSRVVGTSYVRVEQAANCGFSMTLRSDGSDYVDFDQARRPSKVVERRATVTLEETDLRKVMHALAETKLPLPAITEDAALLLAKRLIEHALHQERPR